MVKVSLSFASACRILASGGAVTVAFGTQTEWEWRYGTLRVVRGAYQTRLPGGAWRALYEARDVHASSRDASVSAAYQGAGALAAAFEARRRSVLTATLGEFQLLACIPCRECGKLLSRPCHIRAGVGPECSGKYAQQQLRSLERRAHVESRNPLNMRVVVARRDPTAEMTVEQMRAAIRERWAQEALKVKRR